MLMRLKTDVITDETALFEGGDGKVQGNWYHFVGIGGAGMSGLAWIMLELGKRVSGSDLVASANTYRLIEKGAEVTIGHSAENLQPGIDNVVISSAIPPSNEEVCKARQLGLNVISRGELLSQLMRAYKGIAIVGAHGKTTTSSMISLVLAYNGLSPTFIIGGEVHDIGGNARLGAGAYLVAEADESDGSFLRLEPYAAVITNIDNDHLDYYKDLAVMKQAYQQFVDQVRAGGFTVLCTDNEHVRGLKPGRHEVITYGLDGEPDFLARNIVRSEFKTTAEVLQRGQLLGKLALQVPGSHNVQNALAAVAVGMRLGLTFEQVAAALSTFKGVQRRFQLVVQADGVQIIDDYAHHPTEIRALFKAGESITCRRTIAVFQPHRYTRTLFLQDEFGSAFQGADLVIVTDIYSAGEKPIPGVSADLIVRALQKQGAKVAFIRRLDEVVDHLRTLIRPGDLVLTIGAGDVWKVGQRLANTLETTVQ
jgi:UDP-N-acetylmuramate--alanine ligase